MWTNHLGFKDLIPTVKLEESVFLEENHNLLSSLSALEAMDLRITSKMAATSFQNDAMEGPLNGTEYFCR